MPAWELLKTTSLNSPETNVARRIGTLLRCFLLLLALVTISFSPYLLEGHMQNRQNNSTALSSHTSPAGQPARASHPLALVYRGPGGCEGCSEAVAALLQSSRWNFDIQYVGPKEKLKLSAQTLKHAVLYAQPGGGGNVYHAYKSVVRQLGNPRILTNWIRDGGHFLGICMGGYLAGTEPGFDLLPGESRQWITSPGASWTSEKDTVIRVHWRGKLRWMYFQDGPYFQLDREAKGVTVLATYMNNEIAALTAPYGKGRVGVVGPHPEADESWYQAYNLTNPDGSTADLGLDLIDTLMR